MKHLSRDEIVDAIDGVLPPRRRAHLETCQICLSGRDELATIVRRAAAVEVPEPSPLFWDHLSARVRGAIGEAGGPPPRRVSWHRWPVAAGLMTAVLASLVIIGAWPRPVSTSPGAASNPVPRTTASIPDGPFETPELSDLDADEAWALVTAVADEVEWDEAHDAAISARPGSAERLTQELTPAERRELARLLQDEIRRAGA